MEFEPAELLEPLVAEAKRTISEMAATDDLEKRRMQSEIVSNLCQSLGVFFGMVAHAMDNFDEDEFFDEDDESMFCEEE